MGAAPKAGRNTQHIYVNLVFTEEKFSISFSLKVQKFSIASALLLPPIPLTQGIEILSSDFSKVKDLF